MRSRLQSWWSDISDSLWFLPAMVTAAAVVLAFLTVQLDQNLLLDGRSEMGWLFGGGAEGARGVLQAIAGTMITVTALVFSITVVSLQLASSQLSPRVLRTFMSDRGIQTVLGFFIGTFTYALLVLRVVRSSLEDTGGFVPSLSVTVAILLALLSVGLLIFFVHHATNAMRASVVIDRAAGATRDLITHLYPEDVGEASHPDPPPWLASVPAAVVRAKESGYLQSINADALFALAEHHELVIRPEPPIGGFILPGELLASVWPADAKDQEVEEAVREAMVVGMERTLYADVAFGIQQLSDIAVKALSPGINDPTTAMICIDRLSDVLVAFANRGKPDEVRSAEDGSVRLVLQGPPFAHLAGMAFDHVRHFGTSDPVVAEQLLTSLGRIAGLIPVDHRRPIVHQARLVLATAQSRIVIPEERERVIEAGSWVSAHVELT